MLSPTSIGLVPDQIVPVAQTALAADALLPARNQMALSLGWHIVLACFGMAFPAMIFVLHRRGLRGDDAALELAKRWSKASGVLFAVGAVSGTVLSFEMGLLWPGLMDRYGDVIGLAFALEGIAFFMEAIFLGIYIYGWGRLPGRWHLATLFPVMVSGLIGAFMVVAVNGWMNAPTGFEIRDGEVVDVDPIAAIFNSAAGLQFVHMYLAAVMVVGFIVAGIYANGWLKGRTDRIHRLGIVIPLCAAAVAAPLQPVVGHFAGQRLAAEQPIKLAAMEGLAHTTEAANLEIGGWWNGDHLVGAFEIPIDGLLSFIATNDFGAVVIGLDAVDVADQPPVGIVHIAFQTMVGIGTALIGLAAWAMWRWRRGRDPEAMMASRPLLWALVASGPAAVIAMEAGWVTTEVGRQPWVVHGYLRTADAVTDADYIWITLGLLTVVYAAMTIGVWYVLRSMSRRWRAGEKDLPSPYGPAMIERRTEANPAEVGS